MPAERTTMRHVREVLRLTTAGVGLNEIARRVGVAPSTVRLTLKRLASAGLSWPFGHFWGFLETRPYMRARAGLASTLLQLGDIDSALAHYRDMLKLIPNDNQ